MSLLAALRAALVAHGLLLRGGCAPQPSDGLPPLPDGGVVQWVAMAGVAGSAFWPHFRASPQAHDGRPDPLDRWSRAVGDEIARRFGGIALYPFGGPPHHPFPRWAERAEGLHASPLGLRLHPRYGLWHSWRFALALPQPVEPDDNEPALDPTDLCARCDGQPCLHACPVSAFTRAGYDVERCAAHLEAQPEPACRGSGCGARHACPVGQAFAQQPAHARFLMDAFVAAMAARRRPPTLP
jgi:ferredoxin